MDDTLIESKVPATASTTKKVVSGSFLVAGTAVGAGMLGIPAVTIDAGFAPGMLASLLVWIFMLITGLLLLEVALKCPKGSNILSIAKKYLGNTGRTLAGGMFIFLYYCLIVAYIAGGAPLLASLGLQSLPPMAHYIAFTGITGLVVYSGIRSIDRINIALTVLMVLAFILLFIAGSSEVSKTNLMAEAHYSKMFLAIPVLFGAFGYHNVIPSLCDYLQRDRKVLRLSLALGTLLAMAFYSLWQYLVIGSVDASSLKQAVSDGKTVIFALQQVVANPSLFLWGKWFGALALLTSLLGVSLSMVDFFADGCKILSIKASRLLLCAITFLPPLLFTLLNPKVFTTALGVAGGIGESVLNGLLPIALLWVSKYKLAEQNTHVGLGKLALACLFALSTSVLGIEIYELMR